MLKDAFEFIVSLGAESKRARLIKGADAHPRLKDVVFMEKAGGACEAVSIPPPPRNPVLESIDDILEAVEKLATTPELYISETGITLLLDADSRTEIASMPFQFSERFITLVKMSMSENSFTPKDAVRFLRTKLNGTGVADLAKALSKVDFTRTSSGRSHFEHGKETLGRSVETSVQQADSIPESFMVEIAPLANFGLALVRVKVEVGIYLDLELGKVSFVVLSDEIDRAKKVVISYIFQQLKSNSPDLPVFRGKP